MKLFTFFICVFQTLHAQQPFFLSPKDPYFTEFLKLQLVVRSDMSKVSQRRDDTGKSHQHIVSLPFSGLSNPWQNRFDFLQESRLDKITVHTGSPFFKDYVHFGNETVDAWIACRSMIEHCAYCPESLRPHFLNDWRSDEVGVFFKWSEWEKASCSFSKIPYSQLQSIHLMAMYKRSGFYGDPQHQNQAFFQKLLTHRVARRPELAFIFVARSFAFKPISR